MVETRDAATRRTRRGWTPARAGFALVAMLVGVVIPVSSSFGASGPSAIDYSQCANGPVGAENATACDAWINGILQSSNSHYSEDQVTPQRLVGSFPTAGAHSVTLGYQVRKSTFHAYDSLATWNKTQPAADRCQGLLAADCVVDANPDREGIPNDPNTVDPVGPGESNVTADHMLPAGADREFVLYGAEFAASPFNATPYIHTTSGSDQYAHITIKFVTSSPNQKVMLLFGGHLAVGPGARIRGWGNGMGASDVNGGPYHISWELADGASIGSRDNQIQGDDILPLREVVVETTASPTTAVVGQPTTIGDTASLLGANNPTATTTFDLWGPYGVGVTPTCTGTPVLTLTDATPTLNGFVWQASVSTSHTFAAVGDYYWRASYPGDGGNGFGEELCGVSREKITVGRASSSIATSTTSTLVVGQAGTVADQATVTGVNVTGTVTFTLHGPFSVIPAANACTNLNAIDLDPATAGNSLSATLIGGVASVSTTVTLNAVGSYYWIATYGGDVSNFGSAGVCGDQAEKVIVGKATPGATSKVLLRDRATLTGGFAPTGTVVFKLYGPKAANDSVKPAGAALCDSTRLIYTSAAITLNAAKTATTPESIVAAFEGYYEWVVTYSGDANNNAGVVKGCGTESVFVDYT